MYVRIRTFNLIYKSNPLHNLLRHDISRASRMLFIKTMTCNRPYTFIQHRRAKFTFASVREKFSRQTRGCSQRAHTTALPRLHVSRGILSVVVVELRESFDSTSPCPFVLLSSSRVRVSFFTEREWWHCSPAQRTNFVLVIRAARCFAEIKSGAFSAGAPHAISNGWILKRAFHFFSNLL